MHHVLLALLLALPARAGERVPLTEPDRTRGLPLMAALSARASAREWSDRDLSPQDLSDLLWAANGINRPEEHKRTAPSALNAQDIDLYVFTREGVFRYDAASHALDRAVEGDHRSAIPRSPPARPSDGAAPPASPPVQLVLVSDSTRFRMGTAEQRRAWGAMDAGIVSQNISLFCAATGLATRPRASVDEAGLRRLLSLADTTYVILDHPVGYPR